jgi:hypothetical protein
MVPVPVPVPTFEKLVPVPVPTFEKVTVPVPVPVPAPYLEFFLTFYLVSCFTRKKFINFNKFMVKCE